VIDVADKQENVVLVAIRQAAAHYAPHEWFELPPSHRSRAIYSELQQLDAATSGRLQDVADQSAPVRTRKSGSAT
jgi:hypothetical protein